MLRKIYLILLIAALALSAVAVAAQDATPEATPEAQATPEAAPVAPVYIGIGFDAADNGVLVTDLDPRGPAARGGVKIGDVITAINGETITADTAVETLSQYQPGDEVTLNVERAGEAQDIMVTIASRESQRNAPRPMPRQDIIERPLLGVRLADNDAGAEVAEVVTGSAADEAGLEVGDVITAINGETVSTAQEVQAVVLAQNVGDSITVTVTREGESLDIEATLGAQTSITPLPFQMPRDGQPNFTLPVQPGLFTFIPDDNVYEVGDLPEDSAYYEAGLRSGDRITAINGDSFNNLLFNLHSEESVTITVERDGTAQDIDVPGTIVLDLLMGSGSGMFNMMPDMGGMMLAPLNARLGLMFVMLDEEVAADLDIEQTEGAYVRAVDTDSPAAEAGVQEGDIITAVDGQTLSAELTLRDAITGKNPGDEVTLTVLRDGAEQEIAVTLGEPQMQFHFEHPLVPGEGRPRT